MDEMHNKITTLRDKLLNMHKLGHLRCQYTIEKNIEMAQLMEAMVKCDNKVQILVGDELK